METLEDYLQYAEEILKSPSIRFETAEAQNQTKTRVLTSYTAFVCKGCIRNDNEVSCESLVRGVSLRTLITLRGRFTPKTNTQHVHLRLKESQRSHFRAKDVLFKIIRV